MSLMKQTNRMTPALPRLFDEFFNLDWGGNSFFQGETVSRPAVNVKETDAAFEIELAAPGVKKEDFKVSLEGQTLTVSSESRKESSDESDGKYSRKEFSFRTFSRAFTLPETVNTTEIEANYTDGILYLTLPKREAAEPDTGRLIDIR